MGRDAAQLQAPAARKEEIGEEKGEQMNIRKQRIKALKRWKSQAVRFLKKHGKLTTNRWQARLSNKPMPKRIF